MKQVIADLKIESLAYGGNGLGYHDGKVIFVPQTIPGDRVSCRVVKSKKRFAEARVAKVLEPSAERCAPTCSVFGLCGGASGSICLMRPRSAGKTRFFPIFFNGRPG